MKKLLFALALLPTCVWAQNTAPYYPNGNTAAGITGLQPGAQAVYLMTDGSGTTVTDSSGNGNSCTLASGHLPTWSGTTSPYLSFSGTQWATCPAAAFSNAQTIEIWFNSRTPGNINSVSAIISTDANNGTGLQLVTAATGWGGAPEWYSSGNSKFSAVGDRAVGPTEIGITLGANPQMYVNGHLPLSTTYNVASFYPNFLTTTTTYLGCYKTNSGQCFVGDIYAVIVRAAVATAATIQADDAYVRYTKMAPNNLLEFDKTTSQQALLIRDGDSIVEGGGVTQQFNQTYPYFDALIGKNSFDTYNVSIGGQALINLVPIYATKVHPIIAAHPNATAVVTIGAGTNDIIAGQTAAQVEANLVTYCGYVHADGGKCVFENIISRQSFTTGQAAIAVAVNAYVFNQWQTNTGVFDAVSDRADTPWFLTNIAAGTTNATCFADGTHPTSFCNQLMAQSTALGIQTATAPGVPFWMSVVVPYQALTATATTQTVPFLQLGLNQQVCGAKSTVTTAFAGTSITAISMVVGDSGGTTTQYLPSQSIFSTTKAINQNPNFVSANGIVQGLFTSTGANLSALTAGNVNVDICVVSTP